MFQSLRTADLETLSGPLAGLTPMMTPSCSLRWHMNVLCCVAEILLFNYSLSHMLFQSLRIVSGH